MKVKHMRSKKREGWDQLVVTAELGRRLWIDGHGCTSHKITILEGPEEGGSEDEG